MNTLAPGARGPDVLVLQQQLVLAGFLAAAAGPETIAQLYGPTTEAAVRAFQSARGLDVDGVAGPRTWAALATPAIAPAGTDPIITIGGVRVYLVGAELRWLGPLAVDADGAWNAYGPPGTKTLDALGSAGRPGNWYGIATTTGDCKGEPLVQGDGDPFPGLYVATTALSDHTRRARDQRAYVDSAIIPYVSIPPELRQVGARLGDVALVTCLGKTSPAIVGDVGPHGKLGEGSIALAAALGLDPSPRHGGTERSIVAVRLFNASAATPAWPRTVEDVARQVAALTAPPDPATLS